MHSALESIFHEMGLKCRMMFYFPSIGEYANIIDAHGLKTDYAVLFDRPTPQKTADGLIDWIRMFSKTPFEGLSEEMKEDIFNECRARLEGKLFHS